MGMNRDARRPPPVAARKPKLWGAIAAVVVVLLFAGGIFGYAYTQYLGNQGDQAALAPFTPSEANPDPAKAIPGVVIRDYQAGQHVEAPQRVAYDQNPPYGGTHDQYWADCTGAVYNQPIRTENMVHSLEHGAVWIAYDPDKVTGPALQTLRDRIEGQQYLLMSPVPTLDVPISLQSWGHQLKLDRADDPRIDQFIEALRANRFTYPEVGATCRALGPGAFDPDNPPPFDPAPPGPDSVPVNGSGR